MKIRIKQCTGKNVWYAKNIGEEFEVATENAGYYFVDNNPFGITKEDAEVVEEPKQGFSTEFKKDCRNCRFDPNGCNLMGVECDNFSKWQHEKGEKSCDNCNYDKFNTSEETSCQKHIGICEYYEKWQQIEPTISKTETVEEEYRTCTNCLHGVDKPAKCGVCHPVNKDQWVKQDEVQEKNNKIVYDLSNNNKNIRKCDTCLHAVDRPIELCVPCIQKTKDNWIIQDEIVTNDSGGKQSKSKYLWLDFCPKALLKVAKLSCAGNEKYGKGNWRKISAEEHINHAINHLMLWLAKDTSEDHLTHCAWRVLSALGVEE